MLNIAKPKPKPALPLPHLRHPQAETETFTRGEVAEIFNHAFNASHVSKIQTVLADIKPYEPLERADIWKIYVYQCWRQVQIAIYGKNYAWRKRFQEEFESMGAQAFLERYVYSVGGSKEDCDRLIEAYLAKKFTQKLVA